MFRLGLGIAALVLGCWVMAPTFSPVGAVGDAAGTPSQRAWIVSNEALSLRLDQLRDGGIRLTSLRQCGSPREWSDPAAALFRIEGTWRGRPFALTAASPWQ